MQYAQTGVTAFSGVDGCPGHGYEDRPDKSDPHMSVDCVMCELFLARDPLWSGNPAEVPLTETEKRTAENAKAEADRLASQSVTGAAAIISAIASQPGLLEGLSKLLSGGQQAPAQETAVPGATAPAPGPALVAEVQKPAAKASTAKRAPRKPAGKAPAGAPS